jgi:succinate dehydrogenase / fumarate reductase iron-sulfur subunit
MGQIMRLRRLATSDYHIVDHNNGERHEEAFTGLVRDYGLNHEAELLPRSYGGNSWFGKFHPAAAKELLSSLPVVIKGVLRGKVSPTTALLGHKLAKRDLQSVQRIFDRIEQREQRYELNLFITGFDEDEQPAGAAGNGVGGAGQPGASAAQAGEAPAAAGAQDAGEAPAAAGPEQASGDPATAGAQDQPGEKP